MSALSENAVPGANETPRSDVPVFVEESGSLPLVTLAVAFRTGSTTDADSKVGLARLTARMLRRGCRGMTAEQIESAVDRLGGEFSAEVSESTTIFHAQVIRRNVEPFIELLARIVGSPTFAEDELGRLRRESKAELTELRDNDRALAQRAFRRAVFGEHPYARGSSGTLATLEGITGDDVRQRYARHFTRSNLVLGFAGKIDRSEADGFARQLAEVLPDGARPASDLPDPAPATGRQLVFVDKPERTQTQIIMGGLGTHPHDPDHAALGLATAVFGGTFTSRLMREVRSKRGWSYGASARLGVERKRQAFSMWTFPAATDAGPCIALELDLLASFIEAGITAKELSFIKKYLVRSHAFDVDTAPKRLHQMLDVELLGLPHDYYSGYTRHVDGVTLEAANAAVQNRLSAKNLRVVVVGTASEILEQVQKAIPDLDETHVIPFDRD